MQKYRRHKRPGRGIDLMVGLGTRFVPRHKSIAFAVIVQECRVLEGLSNVTLVGAKNNRQGLAVREFNFCINFVLPFGNRFERARSRGVVNKEGAGRILVVYSCDGSKTILAGDVPELETHHYVVHLELFKLKVNANGRLVVAVEDRGNVSLDSVKSKHIKRGRRRRVGWGEEKKPQQENETKTLCDDGFGVCAVAAAGGTGRGSGSHDKQGWGGSAGEGGLRAEK